MSRALLAHGKFGPVTSKTANAILRFAPDTVACVLDRDRPGERASHVLGFGPDVPVVGDAKEALDLGADELVIGIAPVGGDLPDAWRPDIRAFLEAGCRVTSGLHVFLGDDPELARAAEDGGGRIEDLRRPPADRRIATGDGLDLDNNVIYVSGTDCSSGKMTTSVALVRAARDRGWDAAFVATGQTGLLLDPDAGAPMDAVVSDFLPGEMERQVLSVADRDWVFVEGQGGLGHPAYGAVTMGMVLGACPSAVVMSHVPGRKWREGFPQGTFPVPSLPDEIELTETVLSRTTGASVVAVSLDTSRLSADAARDAVRRAADETGLFAGDPIRDGADAMLDAIEEAVRST